MTDLETRALTLVRVYKIVTADQIAEALKIEWAEAYAILCHLCFAYSAVTFGKQEFGRPTTFHIVERKP